MMKKIYLAVFIFFSLDSFSAQEVPHKYADRAEFHLKRYLLDGSHRREDFKEAFERYDRIAKYRPDLKEDSYYNLALLFSLEYKLHKREEDFKAFIKYVPLLNEQTPRSFNYSFGETFCHRYMQTGELEYFERSRKILELVSQSEKYALADLGFLFLSRYRFEEVAKDLETSLAYARRAVNEVTPPIAEPLWVLGKILEQKYNSSEALTKEESSKVFDEAKTCFEECWKNFKYTPALEGKALLFESRYKNTYDEGDYDRALTAVKDMQKFIPENEYNSYFLGNLYIARYDYMFDKYPASECEKYFKKTFKIMEQANNQLNMGFLYLIKFFNTKDDQDMEKGFQYLEIAPFKDLINFPKTSFGIAYFKKYEKYKKLSDAKKSVENLREILESKTAPFWVKKQAKRYLIALFLESQKLGHSKKLKLSFQHIIPYIEALNMQYPQHQFLKARLLMLLENPPYEEIQTLLEISSQAVPEASRFLEILKESSLKKTESDTDVEALERMLDEGLSNIKMDGSSSSLEIQSNPIEMIGDPVEEGLENEYEINFLDPTSIKFSADEKVDQLKGNIKKLREYKRSQGAQRSTTESLLAEEDSPAVSARDFVRAKKDLLDKLFRARSNLDEKDLGNLLNHDFCRKELAVKETKSGLLVGESMATHHTHGQTYKGLHRKFLKDLKEKITSLLLLHGIADYC